MKNEKSNLEKKLPEFDADLSWKNVQNRKAAKAHGLKYDNRRKIYIDEDGCPVRDKYGQRL